MRTIQIRATAPGSVNEIAQRLDQAAGEIDYQLTRTSDNMLLLEKNETSWWLLGLLAPLHRRRHSVSVLVDGDRVDAFGEASGPMAAFLDAYLLGEERPALSRRLRNLAAR